MMLIRFTSSMSSTKWKRIIDAMITFLVIVDNASATRKQQLCVSMPEYQPARPPARPPALCTCERT